MLRRAAASAVLAAAAVAASLAGAAAGDLFDAATGYRIDRYRSPVDRPLEGGATATTADVDRLLKDGAVLIDVMPARAGYDRKTGRWLVVDRRQNIPGSVWLPNVGFGALDADMSAYLESSLRRLTAERPDRPLIFYCMADCWMSWNAVKRAASLGRRNLYWYPEGSDGWFDADRPLAEGEPWPVPEAILKNGRSAQESRQ